MAVSSRALAIDVGVTVLMASGLFAGLLAANHWSTGWLNELSAGTLLNFAMIIPAVALFACLERFAPATPHKSVREWILNLRISILFVFARQAAIVMSICVAAGLATHSGIGWIDLTFPSGQGVRTLIVASFLSAFIGDFLYYWWHRFQHRSAVLWQQHKLHHMDESLNVVTEYRADWLESVGAIALPAVVTAVLFRLNPVIGVAGVIKGVVVTLWAVFFHANLRVTLGWASVLVAGPQVHRIHHSRLLQHRDRNFAALFPIWDYLFGTYYHPAPDEFPPTGVESETEVRTLAEAVTLSFRGWRQLFQEWLRKRDPARTPEASPAGLRELKPR